MHLSNKKNTKQEQPWWATPAAGWADVDEETWTHYNRYHHPKVEVDEDVVKMALAFGYGSRAAYGTFRAWDDLVEQLQQDWRAAGFERKNPWETVLRAVEVGWKTAGASPEPVPPVAHSVVASVDRVPGGRPDGDHSEATPTEAGVNPADTPVPGGRPGHPVGPR